MKEEELNFEAESKALTFDWVDAINEVIENFKDYNDNNNIIKLDHDLNYSKKYSNLDFNFSKKYSNRYFGN